MALTLIPCRSGSSAGRLGEADDRGLGRAVDRDERLAAAAGLDAMLMIRPPRPCAIIWLAAACRVKSVPATLMRKSRS